LVTVHLNSELINTTGFKGNFTSKLKSNGKSFQVQHGAIIVATGGQEYKGDEYGYGSYPRIVTQLEFEGLLAAGQSIGLPDSVTMIQCVGPAESYCSRICCTTALKNALKLKQLNPEAQITILYREIVTYGFKERLYRQARHAGINFIHYEFYRKPEVEIMPAYYSQESLINIRIWDPVLKREIALTPDILVLSTPIVPAKGAHELARQLKLSTDMDGFFLEAHVKLRPVDFVVDGVFMAGSAHYPKFLDETIAQAQAAASRAAMVLSQETMLTNAQVAHVDPTKCVGCQSCVRICPYDVPSISHEFIGVGAIAGAAFIEPSVCHGCGSCASECPAQAIQLMGYSDAQTVAKVDALFSKQLLVSTKQ
jgi:heterodisulfide reductase subunit A-like polyferredoxin